ncbi:MAG: S41 family peptidase, partial [Sulfuricaulis sp.]|nr:S41 family peptidase [Sulfuricaulis sp.]
MKLATRYILVLFLGMFVGAAIILDMGVLAEREAPKEALAPLPLDELRTFTEVFSRIKSDYVEPVEDKKLLEDSVQGMLSGLDPHSAYLDAQSFKDMRVETEGLFGGLGIEVTMENGFIKVVSPIEDTPAARAGVKPGDLVIRLDDKAVKGLTLTEAVRIMRGKPGTDITLTIVREGESKPLKLTLTRAVIKIQSVKNRILEPGFGYVRITQFQAGTDKGLAEAIKKLEVENKGNLRGMILDLRNNPGGVLNSAVGVSDTFLDSGLIVYTEGRVTDSKMKLSATPGDLLNGAPIVVLINGGSASASEIVAGALQDHKRAVIMGTKSFGKGSVQTIIPISNGAALKITTARYYTPSGRSI